jgi:hypothetical protein
MEFAFCGIGWANQTDKVFPAAENSARKPDLLVIVLAISARVVEFVDGTTQETDTFAVFTLSFLLDQTDAVFAEISNTIMSPLAETRGLLSVGSFTPGSAAAWIGPTVLESNDTVTPAADTVTLPNTL